LSSRPGCWTWVSTCSTSSADVCCRPSAGRTGRTPCRATGTSADRLTTARIPSGANRVLVAPRSAFAGHGCTDDHVEPVTLDGAVPARCRRPARRAQSDTPRNRRAHRARSRRPLRTTRNDGAIGASGSGS
jgi:hypothetical protein